MLFYPYIALGNIVSFIPNGKVEKKNRRERDIGRGPEKETQRQK